LYSLGLTLYELLTLRPAFDAAQPHELLPQVLHAEPPTPRRLNPEIPRDLETIVLKAMARDPAQRYQTATELADDLQRFLEDRPIRARRVTVRERLWRWCRRNPALAALASCVVLSLLAVAVIASVAAWQDAALAEKESKARKEAEEARATAEA